MVTKERLQVLLYNAIRGLEENGIEGKQLLNYLGMTQEEYDEVMDSVILEVIEELESWDIEPTKENMIWELNKWITNLYSHVGKAAHGREAEIGIIDETGIPWEEQDAQMLQKIETYKATIKKLGGSYEI